MPDSPQMQKFSRSLPATPKSVSDASNAVNMGDEGVMVDSENANDSETNGDDDKVEYEYDGEFDDSASEDQQKFVLAPTPAQLGRAPLQRRLGSLVSSDSNSEICMCYREMDRNRNRTFLFNLNLAFDFAHVAGQSQTVSNESSPSIQQIIATPTSVPSALPTPNSAAMDDVQSNSNSQQSPSLLKRPTIKKNKGDVSNK